MVNQPLCNALQLLPLLTLACVSLWRYNILMYLSQF